MLTPRLHRAIRVVVVVRSGLRRAAAQSVVNNLRNPANWIPFTRPWQEHRANISRVLGVMRNLLQEVHDRQGS